MNESGSAVSKDRKIIFTLGHSNHTIDRFLNLLRKHGITALADVRSSPYSRRYPWFNQETLEDSLKAANIRYLFMGRELGARTRDPSCYLDNGQVDFWRLARNDEFRKGLGRVLEEAGKYRLALMCAEKEPLDCHRTILVCHELKSSGVRIKHIWADGSLEDHSDAESRLLKMTKCEGSPLFPDEKEFQADLQGAYEKRAREIAYVAENAGVRNEGNEEFPW